ncbi:MAG TPA: ABC transporter substrate-binding protein [Stellaceae bacterium]|jgi:NitT/TauT family transport system substrate-binding protein
MRVIKILMAAAVLILIGSGAGKADPLDLRVGWVTAPGSAVTMILMKPDLSLHQGVTYKLDAIHFASTAVAIAPLAANQVDIAGLSYSAISAAIENAHLDDLRVIGDEIENGVDDHENGSGFLVVKDGPIKRVEDLKGKVVAVLTIGSATDMQARVMLRRHGLEDKRDYSIIEAQFPNMKSLLAEGKAATVAIAPPWAFDPELRGQSRMLFTETDAMGPTQLVAMVTRKPFLDKNRAAMVDFLEDTVRTVRWFTDPKNHEAAIALVGEFNKQPPTQLERLFTREDNYRKPKGEPNLQALQHSLDLQHDMGIQKTKIDIGQYADVSLVREAAARLK